MKKIFVFLFYTMIPSIAAYCSSSSKWADFCIEHNILSESFDIALAQEIFLLVSIVFTVAILGVKIIWIEIKLESAQKRIAGLYNVIKQIFKSNFESISKNSSFECDLRIFVPEITPKYLLQKLFKNASAERYFIIKNIAPFAKVDITEHLKFRVSPNPQGLVGECYRNKAIVFDDHLLQSNSTEWNLTNTQINRTSSLLWSICVPITDSSNNVVAVLAFDSCQSPLNIEENKETLRRLTNTFSFLLHDSVPDLFKGKWLLK